jgi:hypothetical protein
VLYVTGEILINKKGNQTSSATVKNQQSFKHATADDPERAAHNCIALEKKQRETT